MPELSLDDVVITFAIIAVSYYLAKKIIRGSQLREQSLLQNGIDVNVTILSLKQTGLFINNNPVAEMKLRVVDPLTGNSWLVEKHKEAILLITLDVWQVGNIYHAKTDIEKKQIFFVRDNNDRPIRVN